MLAALTKRPWISLGFMVTVLTACSIKLQLEPTGVRAANFAGTWKLSSSQSDNVEAGMRRAFETMEAKARRSDRRNEPMQGGGPRAPGVPGPEEGSSDGQAPLMQSWWLKEQRREEDSFIRDIMPPAELRIVQSPGRMELAPVKGGAKRSFEPGMPSTLVTEYASMRIQSGWEGGTFVVHCADSAAKLTTIERYSLTGDDELTEQLIIELPQMKAQTYRVVYRRAPAE